MKRRISKLFGLFTLVLAMSMALLSQTASAQNQKTTSKMQYHGGQVQTGTSNVYFIWYGCWTCGTPGTADTQRILVDFITNFGGSPYAMINTTYPDADGNAPSGVAIYGGSVDDAYSHGPTLTESDMQGIVANQFQNGGLPLDPWGIFIVIASPDVVDTYADGTSFCTPSKPPHHGIAYYNGSETRYAFIGDAARCLSTAAPQFFGPGSTSSSPNGNIAADAMASSLAHALDTVLTDPFGTAWFDRYGLENADKCTGTFGQTYTTANGARANMKLGFRDYLIQQNWINGRRSYCGLSLP